MSLHLSTRDQEMLDGVIVMALATSMSLSSQATLISFQLYPTGSSNPDIASQFEVQLTDPGNHQALFMIHNNGPVQSTITDVLFYDGALLGIAALQDKDDTIGGLPGLSTVDFTKGAPFRPDRLPSYPAATFGADRDSRGGASNGIDSGEWLGVLFDLKTDPNLNFQDLLNGLASGEVSVGLHVQRIGETGGSDWYQSKTPSSTTTLPVPDGGLTVAFLGIVCFGLVGLRRVLVRA